MAKIPIPTIEINFTVDARRLEAVRPVLGDIIDQARQSDESSGYWAGQLGMALLEADFIAGSKGIAEDPPFFTEERAPGALEDNTKDVYCVCADGFTDGSEPQVIIAVTQDAPDSDPKQYAEVLAATLNRIVIDWLARRIENYDD